jgi:hypothetical protein
LADELRMPVRCPSCDGTVLEATLVAIKAQGSDDYFSPQLELRCTGCSYTVSTQFSRAISRHSDWGESLARWDVRSKQGAS